MAGKTTATYWATTGIECGDWRVEAGNELVGYPDVLDIKGLLQIAAITTVKTEEVSPVETENREDLATVPVIENAEVTRG